MIPDKILRYLIVHRIKDAETLIKDKRYPAAIYLAGYAVEIALKRKICLALNFNSGFPETKQELSYYLEIKNAYSEEPIKLDLKEIKNHNFEKLLTYSGEEYRIKETYSDEWYMVARWNPENRYKKMRVIKKTAQIYIDCVKRLVKGINLN